MAITTVPRTAGMADHPSADLLKRMAAELWKPPSRQRWTERLQWVVNSRLREWPAGEFGSGSHPAEFGHKRPFDIPA
jgi:hypothetical protein